MERNCYLAPALCPHPLMVSAAAPKVMEHTAPNDDGGLPPVARKAGRGPVSAVFEAAACAPAQCRCAVCCYRRLGVFFF